MLANDGLHVGEVRAIYGSGDARVVEFLLVHWTHRGEDALVGADEVTSVGDDGVMLGKNAASYADLPAFDPASNPVLHRL